MHFKWLQRVGKTRGFLFCVSLCRFFDEDCRGHRGYFHFSVFLARWKYIRVFLKDEVFSASSAERMNVPHFLPERTSLTEESCFLCSVTSHLGIQRALFITPLLEIHTKLLDFLLSLTFSSVPTETARMLRIHHVPSPPPQKLRAETFPPGALNKFCLFSSYRANPQGLLYVDSLCENVLQTSSVLRQWRYGVQRPLRLEKEWKTKL